MLGALLSSFLEEELYKCLITNEKQELERIKRAELN